MRLRSAEFYADLAKVVRRGEMVDPERLVELEEGTRVVTNVEGVDRGDLQIGMALEATFVDYDDELSLPVFRPASAPSGGTT